mgnify:CR=1 FL=1
MPVGATTQDIFRFTTPKLNPNSFSLSDILKSVLLTEYSGLMVLKHIL